MKFSLDINFERLWFNIRPSLFSVWMDFCFHDEMVFIQFLQTSKTHSNDDCVLGGFKHTFVAFKYDQNCEYFFIMVDQEKTQKCSLINLVVVMF